PEVSGRGPLATAEPPGLGSHKGTGRCGGVETSALELRGVVEEGCVVSARHLEKKPNDRRRDRRLALHSLEAGDLHERLLRAEEVGAFSPRREVGVDLLGIEPLGRPEALPFGGGRRTSENAVNQG